MSSSIIEFSAKLYSVLLPFAWMALGFCVAILLPLSIFRKLRKHTGKAIYQASFLIGLTTWFLGATITLATWGWLALTIGLFLFGLGVVPLGILAAFITLKNSAMGFSLIVMSLVTYGFRLLGNSIRLSGLVNDDDYHEDEEYQIPDEIE